MGKKLITFRLDGETVDLLKAFKERNKIKTWDETFFRLMLLEQKKIVTHQSQIKDLKPCANRLIACSKAKKEIALEDCIKCNQQLLKFI